MCGRVLNAAQCKRYPESCVVRASATILGYRLAHTVVNVL